MTAPYVDLNTIHDPTVGGKPPASWGDGVRTNLEGLARPPGCVVVTSTGTNATDTTWTSVAWNGSDLRDTDGVHAGTSANLTVPFTGWYQFNGQLSFPSNATGMRLGRVSVGGADTARLFQLGSVAGLALVCSFSADLFLTAAEVVTLQAWQSSGITLAVSGRVSMRLVAWS